MPLGVARNQRGDKILLPPSAFDTLARLQVDYPMLFQLTCQHGGGGGKNRRTTHSGVLEFTAEEGCVYIPHWMMQNLLLEEGMLITVTNVSLPKATFVKLQPQSTDFLEISNPRAVLEHALRNYSCVTVHDIIQIPYNNKNYHFELKVVEPSPAACIIETDCNVDFDAPVGYVEPDYSGNMKGGAARAASSSSLRSSACPSPETATTASTGGAMDDSAMADAAPAPRRVGVRIVDGQIVRPDDAAASAMVASDLMAEKTGATGVQHNAAIPSAAPEIGYWAVSAGEGARLDGKPPAVLKDADGREVNVRQLRADAAARRAAASVVTIASASGQTVAGHVVVTVDDDDDGKVPPRPGAAPSQRKARVGSKYSRLKSSATAFQGAANQVHDKK